MNVPRSNATILLTSRWFLILLFLGLTAFLTAAASGPLGAEALNNYYPMQARYIGFFGLTKPLHSFFFWAMLGLIGVSIFLRTIQQQASRAGTLLLLFVLIAGTAGALVMPAENGPSAAMTVNLPKTGRLEMIPGQVYRFNANNQEQKASLRMTDAGPLVLTSSAKGLYAFLPVKTDDEKAGVRLCRPRTSRFSSLAILLDALALLALLAGIGIHLFARQKT